MTPEPPITFVDHAGHHCLKLSTVHGSALVSLHGGHLLSWVPLGGRDVLWLSPAALPEPAAIRGGVPICWPWFAKEGMPEGAMQHGPVRNALWSLMAVHAAGQEAVDVELSPAPELVLNGPMAHTNGLKVALRIRLGQSLVQELTTSNKRDKPFVLTQAMHTYFAVGDVEKVSVHGLDGARYKSRLELHEVRTQVGPVTTGLACDSTFVQTQGPRTYQYALVDPAWQRTIQIETSGSQSMVVWNPGQLGAQSMADVPSVAWRDFLCVETANAADDRVHLEPGASHTLRQLLRCVGE